MEHDVNLNIHYAAPQETWDKISAVYASMPHWAGDENGPHWAGPHIDLWASVEPSGVQIAGTMPAAAWDAWYACLRQRLSAALGFAVGEPEEGFAFPERL